MAQPDVRSYKPNAIIRVVGFLYGLRKSLIYFYFFYFGKVLIPEATYIH